MHRKRLQTISSIGKSRRSIDTYILTKNGHGPLVIPSARNSCSGRTLTMQLAHLTLLILISWDGTTHAAIREASTHDAFIELIHDSKHKKDWTQLHMVNNFVNRALAYQTDQETYGRQDHWAGPRESMQAGVGDCEDYAFAKYVALRAMGVPDSQLRLVAARLLPSGENHMVLHYASAADGSFILDNVSTTILPANERRDLRTIYSFNESGIWLPGMDAPFLPMTNAQWSSILKEIPDTISTHH